MAIQRYITKAAQLPLRLVFAFFILLALTHVAFAADEALLVSGAPDIQFPKSHAILEGMGRGYIYRNSVPVYTPEYGWMSRGPVSLAAGDLLTVKFFYQNLGDSYSGWLSGPVYLWNEGCGLSWKLADAISAPQLPAPEGSPVEGPAFFDRSYRMINSTGNCPAGEECIFIDKLSCRPSLPLQIISMKPASQSVIKLRDSRNRLINTQDMEFPPEVFSPRDFNGQVVSFQMTAPASQRVEYTVDGAASIGDTILLYFPERKLVFESGASTASISYDSLDELFSSPRISKISEVKFAVRQDGAIIGFITAPKPIYVVLDRPLGFMKSPRTDLLDLATEMAADAFYDWIAMLKLESGIYSKYRLPTRLYGRSHYNHTIRTFFLSLFLADNSADSADLSILQMLLAQSLGIDAGTARVVGNTSRIGALTVENRHYCLGELKSAKTKVRPAGWHQVVYLKSPSGTMSIFDPSFSFEASDGIFSQAEGEALKTYRKHWQEKRLRWQIEKVRLVKYTAAQQA